jgi:hypothetical protein
MHNPREELKLIHLLPGLHDLLGSMARLLAKGLIRLSTGQEKRGYKSKVRSVNIHQDYRRVYL